MIICILYPEILKSFPTNCVSCFELKWGTKLKISIPGFQCPEICQKMKPQGQAVLPPTHGFSPSAVVLASLQTTRQSLLQRLELALNQLVQMGFFSTFQVCVGRLWGMVMAWLFHGGENGGIQIYVVSRDQDTENRKGLKIILLSQISQPVKENTVWSHLKMEPNQKKKKNTSKQNRTRDTEIKNKLIVTRG